MKPQSLSILFILITACLFLIGFRLGKYVERLDKSYAPPTPIVSPTDIVAQPTNRPLSFKTITHDCGVSFTYPTYLKVEKEASEAAVLKNGAEYIALSCMKKIVTNAEGAISPASTSGELKTVLGQKIRFERLKKAVDTWSIRSKTGKTIIFETSTNLTDLVVRTLE